MVLDSATFHFRQDFTDAAQRSRLMLSMAQQLAQLAEQRGVAVVMVNQVCATGLEECVWRVTAACSCRERWVFDNKLTSLAHIQGLCYCRQLLLSANTSKRPTIRTVLISCSACMRCAHRLSHASQTPAVPQEQAPQPVPLAVAAVPTVEGCWRLPSGRAGARQRHVE